MFHITKVFKNSLHTIVFTLVGLFATLYVAMRFNLVQYTLNNSITANLEALLDTRVSIREIEIPSFNQIALNDMIVYDRSGDTLIYVRRAMTAYELWPLLKGNLRLSNIQLIGFELNGRRPSPDGEDNFQFVIDALAPRQKDQKRKVINDLDINAISLRQGRVSYEVQHTPRTAGHWDANHIEVKDISASLRISIHQQQGITILLKRLNLEEQSGLKLHQCRLNLHLDNEQIALSRVEVGINDSRLTADTLIVANDPNLIIAQEKELPLLTARNLHIAIVPTDLNRISTGRNKIDVPIDFTADIFGTSKTIDIPHLDIRLLEQLHIDAHVTLSDLSASWDSLFLTTSIYDSEVSPQAMKLILDNFWDWHSPEVCALIDNLGTLHFEGNCKGRPAEFSAGGVLNSDAGEIVATAELKNDFERKTLDVKSDIQTDHFDMGKVLDAPKKWGHMTATLYIDGTKQPDSYFKASVRGEIDEIEVLHYPYHNIYVNGIIDGSCYDGTLKIEEPDGHLEASGFVDWGEKMKSFRLNAKLQEVDLNRLHLSNSPHLRDVKCSCLISSDMQVFGWDGAEGVFAIDSILLTKQAEELRLESVKINASTDEEGSMTRIESPVLDLEYSGTDKVINMLHDVQQLLSRNCGVISDLKLPASPIDRNDDDHYSFVGRIPANRDLSRMFDLPFTIYQDILFSGQLQRSKRTLHCELNIPDALYQDLNIRQTNLTIENRVDDLDSTFIYASYDGLCERDQQKIESHVAAELRQNKLQSTAYIDFASGDNTVQSQLSIDALLDSLSISLHPEKILVNDTLWTATRLHISQAADQSIRIEDFSLRHGNQRLGVGGYFSTNHDCDMKLRLEKIDLGALFNLIGSPYVAFGGIGTGDFYISAHDSLPMLKTDHLQIENFSYIDGVLGNADFNAWWNLKEQWLHLETDVRSGEAYKSFIEGDIHFGKRDTIDVTFHTDHLPVDFLSYWLGGIMQDFHAQSSGDIHLFGDTHALNLLGHPFVHNGTFTTDILGTRFHFDDSLHLDDGAIRFKHITLLDDHGAECDFNADIRHSHLVDYHYRVDIDIPQRKSSGFMVFNHPYKTDGSNYWGQLFADGHCRIEGGDGEHRFMISARTTGNSKFYLSPNENSYSDNSYNFLMFRNKEQLTDKRNADNRDDHYTLYNSGDNNSGSNIIVDLMIEATPNCQIYILMDPLAEDRLDCQGYGNLNVKYDTRHDLNLIGQYNIQQGKYNITMRGDLMSKDFKIENGSTVNFAGNPMNANLDIQAIYSIPSVNLTDLDETFATTSSMSRTSAPVDCRLNVTGELSAPQISFDIEVKRVSADVQAMVKNIIGTQEMMNRQIFYLLLFNKFYTPEYANNGQTRNNSELTSFASASLTSQLNNLLGQMSNYVSVGTNFRSDKGDFSDMEMDLALSTRFLNNRLLLNGNLGYRDPANNIGLNNNTSSFIGDFDLEYLINPKGTLRFKAYSHYNERDYSINNALTTQGAGIIIRRDFKRIQDLLWWKKPASKE